MFKKNTAEAIWDSLEFRDLDDEIKGPLMSGTAGCSSLTCTQDWPCNTNAFCSTQLGCRPGPGFGKKK